jgi:hypothetical protein
VCCCARTLLLPNRPALRWADAAPTQGHTDQLRAVLLDVVDAQRDILLAPNVGRSRHLLTPGGAPHALRCGACLHHD